MKALLFLSLVLATSPACFGLVWKVVPVEAVGEVFSHVHASYVQQEGAVHLSVYPAPEGLILGPFRGYSLRVLDRPVASVDLQAAYFDHKSTVRKDASSERRSTFRLSASEAPYAYLALRYDTPQHENYDSVIFCLPLVHIMEACDRKTNRLREEPNHTPTQRGEG